jgi:hypothetical protein
VADHDTFAVRPRRQVPPPKHPRSTEGDTEPREDSTDDPSETEASSTPQPLLAAPPRQLTRRTVARSATTAPAPEPELVASEHPLTTPTDPLANLAVRVRRPLDKRLGSLVYKLGEEEVKTSKAELIEMLLWELPAEPTDEFRHRLAAFRRAAPRETPLA